MPCYVRLSRRTFLARRRPFAAQRSGSALPALDAMFNASGTAYAATRSRARKPIETRFVFWFNGNGITEKYWIPAETGADFELTPCLKPLAPFRNDIHVISGSDNPAARLPGPGNGHHHSMSALVSGEMFTGRGAGGPSIDQADRRRRSGQDSRFRSLQIGVCQESFGESIQRNMSWAGSRPAAAAGDDSAPAVRPAVRLARSSTGSSARRAFSTPCRKTRERSKSRLGAQDQQRLDEYLTSVRDLERSIASLPPDIRTVVEQPPEGGDLKDWPRIAKLQTDLLVHALASRQTRVASYMLTKCQGLSRFPWLGLHLRAASRIHARPGGDAARACGSCATSAAGTSRSSPTWWAKLKSMPEGDGTLLDHTCLLFVHEHAEANSTRTTAWP